jgi:plastocyanin
MRQIPRLALALFVLLFGMVFASQAALPTQRFGWQLYAGAYQGPPVLVGITSTGFVPSVQVLQTGGTIRWTNNTNTVQTVTSDTNALQPVAGPTFDSGPLAPGQSFEFRFDVPGTFAYHSVNTPGLTGKIVVAVEVFDTYLPVVSR